MIERSKSTSDNRITGRGIGGRRFRGRSAGGLPASTLVNLCAPAASLHLRWMRQIRIENCWSATPWATLDYEVSNYPAGFRVPG